MSAEPLDSLTGSMPRGGRAIRLTDGAVVTLRPVAPEDKPLLVEVFDGMSEESRYRRFFTSLQKLTTATLAYFTELDHCDREAIIALEPASGRALGVVRYVRLHEDPAKAEVAVAVVDNWHGRGVATALLAGLTQRAQEEGIAHFVAFVQATNRAALDLLEGAGDPKLEHVGRDLEFVIDPRPVEASRGKRQPTSESRALAAPRLPDRQQAPR